MFRMYGKALTAEEVMNNHKSDFALFKAYGINTEPVQGGGSA